MNKNLPVKEKNSKVALLKTKSLIGIANRILTKNNGLVVEGNSWIEHLWEWADKNDISDLKSMDSEIYEWNYMGGLPRNKEKLLNLDGLNLPYCEITRLPKDIGKLIKLDALCLHYGNLRELTSEIGHLKNLTYLDLHENSINALPKELGHLKNLTHLGLNYNILTKLPQEITKLTNLTYIGLLDNPRLILTGDQKKWISTLKNNGCIVEMDDELLNKTEIHIDNILAKL